MGAERIFMRGVMGIIVFTACVSPALCLTPLPPAWEKSAQTMYEHGWFLESSEKNFNGALETYRALMERFADDKNYCALAQTRIGACLDAQGKSDEARAAWQKVLADYPDQPEAVKNARLLMAGIDPFSVGSFEEMKKQVEGILNTSSPWPGTNSQIMSALAAAYPAEAADFLHAKLVELGKSAGPVLAQGKAPWKDSQTLYVVGMCLQALASCDTEKTRDYLLELLKHAGEPEGQFLGKNTAHSIIISFVYLQPPYVNDDVVDIVIKDTKEGVEPPQPGAMVGRPFNPTFMFYYWPEDRYTLAVFADFNAKALDYLRTEAMNAADEKGATLAMLFMTRLRKPETAAFYTEIATGKYPEEFRRTAIACLGGLGEPRHLPQKMTMRLEEDATLFQFVQWRMYAAAGAWYQPVQMFQKERIVEPDKALLDECVKGLKAAYDFNNSILMRGEVITAFELLGRGAAKEPLLDYAKNAVDPEVREMAARALGDLFEHSEKDADVAALLDGLMKGDSSPSVRVQAAWALSKLSHPIGGPYLGPRLLMREAIPVMLEGLQEYKGSPPSTVGNIALNISQTDALNSMLLTTFHGELVTPDYRGAYGAAATATDDFAKWWEVNKDKSDAEWAMAGVDEWVKKMRESLAGSGAFPSRMIIDPYVNELIDSEVGRLSSYAPDSQREQAKAVCDWWEKNRDKVTWNSDKRCFELKP